MKNQEEYEKLARKIFEKEISNALQNDKGNAMLSSLIQQICRSHIQDKVKKYCQKYVKQEIQRYFEETNSIRKSSASSQNVLHEDAKDLYGLFSMTKVQESPLTSKSSCKNCGDRFEGEQKSPKAETKKNGKEKLKIVELTKNKSKETKLPKKTPFLKKIKSQEKVHLVKGDPINLLTGSSDLNEKIRGGKEARLKKAKSQKSGSNIFGTQYSWKDKDMAYPMMTQEVSQDKMRKVQKHLSKISDSGSGYQLQEEYKLKKIIEDNGHLGSKEIAHLIKGMQDLQDISKVVKLQSNQIEIKNDNLRENPFHQPSGISRRNKKSNEHYDFSMGERKFLERERGESEYLVRTQYSPELQKGKSYIEMSSKNMKNNKQKGKIFMKMLQIYGEDYRTAMFHFIEKNEHLPETQIISRWENQMID